MANTNLKEAKAAKNDEFYTQFHDIESEMMAYLEYDPDVFRDKTVLLPCDDPEWSNLSVCKELVLVHAHSANLLHFFFQTLPGIDDHAPLF